MKKILLKSIVGLTVALFASACSLDEYNPYASDSDVVTLSKFENWKGFQSNCYSGLHGTVLGLTYGTTSELGTDLWTFPFNGTNLREIMAYQDLTNTYGHVSTFWNMGWSLIKDCNLAIKFSSGIVDGDPEKIKVLVAETKVLRAYFYSTLVTQFGELPLLLTGDENTLSPKRSSVEAIYAQIIKDLTEAAADLGTTPYENNPQRVTKKAALGLLARVYAQGGGEGLYEGEKSYWQRALDVSTDLITNQATYGARLYDDFSEVFASKNNRNNAEVLFVAHGPNPYDPSYTNYTGQSKPNLYLFFYPKFDDVFPPATGNLFKRSVNSNTSNAYYGRCNQQFIAPTKYLIDCYDAKYDKRWENTFVTAFTNYSGVQARAQTGVPAPANVTYAAASQTLTEGQCAEYGIDPVHVGKTIFPYVDVNFGNSTFGAGYQYSPKVWAKGKTNGNVADLIEVANGNVHPYPLEKDENRFFVYLSKENLTDEDKNARAYVTINLDDLFDPSDPTGATYKINYKERHGTNQLLSKVWPAMMKFNHNFDGGWLGGNFQQKLGNIFIQRMSEIYLIAAEATLKTGGSEAIAADYLNKIRERACRNTTDFNSATGMQLTTADMNTVFDEYARELCGEFTRWALLKRHRAFPDRLSRYNKPASINFDPNKHYLRPIPFAFLNQINNKDEFGTNGY